MQSSTPKVSIGLPVYNGERYLREALDSILGQTFRDFELIICDNASTDETAAICADYAARDPRIRYHRQTHNIGATANFNHTFELARGAYFKWAAHDDVLAPTWLEKCVASARSGARCGALPVAGRAGRRAGRTPRGIRSHGLRHRQHAALGALCRAPSAARLPGRLRRDPIGRAAPHRADRLPPRRRSHAADRSRPARAVRAGAGDPVPEPGAPVAVQAPASLPVLGARLVHARPGAARRVRRLAHAPDLGPVRQVPARGASPRRQAVPSACAAMRSCSPRCAIASAGSTCWPSRCCCSTRSSWPRSSASSGRLLRQDRAAARPHRSRRRVNGKLRESTLQKWSRRAPRRSTGWSIKGSAP